MLFREIKKKKYEIWNITQNSLFSTEPRLEKDLKILNERID